jgi:pseudouridine-5'-phosphate glycosidase
MAARDRHGAPPLIFSEEVADAVNEGRPLVALESNVITHGLPYPQNAMTARKVEEAVRSGGSVPATICVEDGRIVVGMTDPDIERFAGTPGIPKVSSRDMPVVLAGGGMGALTVASCLVAADRAGIAFFSSAGIGGVHRGAERTMDVSSDLVQFTRSKVAVVCAGAKSILDLALTVEYLETLCVPVVSYRSDDFPAFYCVSSPTGRWATAPRSSSPRRSTRRTRSRARRWTPSSPRRSPPPTATGSAATPSRST